MKIKELTIFEFDEFAKSSPLKNYRQTSNYALLMSEQGFDYDFIGYVDYNDKIVAASLIIYKKIGWNSFYGYAPSGFLLDYFNDTLLNNFTKDLREYYSKKNFVFIKINPEIAIGEVKYKDNYKTIYNSNTSLINSLNSLGYKYLKQSTHFESLIPRFNGIINLQKFSLEKCLKNTRNKIRKGYQKGLELEVVSYDKIDIFYNFVKSKRNNDVNYYKDYFNVFSRNDLIDLFLVKINYEKYLINMQSLYDEEMKKNNEYNEIIKTKPTKTNINKKMESDKIITILKNNIIKATNGLKEGNNEYIAGALVIKYENRIYFSMSGYNKKYKSFCPNYFLHYEILNYYKDEFKFADLNGLTGDFSKENPYNGLNRFKFGFNPRVFEFFGEADLVINEKAYNSLLKSNKLNKIFQKN